MCGGSVEIHPCSHVGHIFRKNSPYTFPRKGGVGGVLHHNLARVATVWMEKWAEFFFKVNPGQLWPPQDVLVRSSDHILCDSSVFAVGYSM